jgi:hypothetical protein
MNGKTVKDFHSGDDFGESIGKPIYATHDGRVAAVRWDAEGYGNYVVLNSGTGFSTLSAHALSVSVKEGVYVKSGDIIGKVGSTGGSSGPHLHFEVRADEYGSLGWWDKDKNGRRINAVDPKSFLDNLNEPVVRDYKLNAYDANKLIKLLHGVFALIEDTTKITETENEIHRLANELRKASGQPIA